MDLVSAELPARTLVVAIDPGKVTHRVLLKAPEITGIALAPLG